MDYRVLGLVAVLLLSLASLAYATRCYHCSTQPWPGTQDQGPNFHNTACVADTANAALLERSKVDCATQGAYFAAGLATRCSKHTAKGVTTRTCIPYRAHFENRCAQMDGETICSCSGDYCNL